MSGGGKKVVKGIILAGGLGTRLKPLTDVTNKHLLPVYNKPMIFYPLELLKNAGITNIIIVTGPEWAGDFLRVLGSGKNFDVRISYAFQDEPGGIAQALSLTEDFVGDDKCVVVLGDNIIEDDIAAAVERFQIQGVGARIFLKEVNDPERFGVAEVTDNKIISIVEKPKQPKSNLAVTGVYMYDSQVFDIIKTLKPSNRGELEITDVNNTYLKNNQLEFEVLSGFWTDAGTFPSLHRAWNLIQKKES